MAIWPSDPNPLPKQLSIDSRKRPPNSDNEISDDEMRCEQGTSRRPVGSPYNHDHHSGKGECHEGAYTGSSEKWRRMWLFRFREAKMVPELPRCDDLGIEEQVRILSQKRLVFPSRPWQISMLTTNLIERSVNEGALNERLSAVSAASCCLAMRYQRSPFMKFHTSSGIHEEDLNSI